nr:hypothetical protein GCM10025699_17390 [Microbacterium flavescens]
MNSDQWTALWLNGWIQLAVTVVGGLTPAGILAIFSRGLGAARGRVSDHPEKPGRGIEDR